MPCLTSARARSLASFLTPKTSSAPSGALSTRLSSEPRFFVAGSRCGFSSSASPRARFASASVSRGSSQSSACSKSQDVTAAIRRRFCSLKLVFSSSAVGRTEAHARATAPAAKPFLVNAREDLRSTSSGSTAPAALGAGVGFPLGLDEGRSAGSRACHSEGAAAAVPAAMRSSSVAFAPPAAAAAAAAAASRTRLPPRGPVPMLALPVVCASGGRGSPKRGGLWLPETTMRRNLWFRQPKREVRSENSRERADNARRAQPPPRVFRGAGVCVPSSIHGVADAFSLSLDAPELPV